MANICPYPRFRVINTDGTPLNGGKIYTYETGTSNDKATYTDDTEGSANANPVILDSRGEADIWLLTDGEYRFVIKNSSDTTLFTIDNIIGIFEPSGTDYESHNIQTSGGFEIRDNNNKTLIELVPNSTPVNYFDLRNKATSNDVVIQAAGDDTNIDLHVTIPGTGDVIELNNNTFNFNSSGDIVDANENELLELETETSAVNYPYIANSTTGNDVSVTAAGDDTNINIEIDKKGSGAITIDGLSYPTADGSSGHVMSTDGSGTISMGAPTVRAGNFAYTSDTAVSTTSTAIPHDDTVPQSTEGAEILTVNYTPASDSSTLLIEGIVYCANTLASTSPTRHHITAALFKDSDTSALESSVQTVITANKLIALPIRHSMTSGTTNQITFKLRVGSDSGTVTINGASGSRLFGGKLTSTLLIREV